MVLTFDQTRVELQTVVGAMMEYASTAHADPTKHVLYAKALALMARAVTAFQ